MKIIIRFSVSEMNPSGTELVVAVANLVLVYATEDGDLRHRLRGHKDLVYTVSYGREGSRFASGGADNTVIIWNSKGDGILKYTHSESIQVVAHNPACDQLASCTEGDFGLWSSTAKSVTKHKVGARKIVGIVMTISVLFVSIDIWRTPEATALRWGFIILTIFAGPLAAFFYVLGCREPFPGAHERYVSSTWKQVLGL